ncbi:4-alpha-glucanotransferase [Bremerella alba]|uniref:4-alpha-glucanotransferase n=1 Tax=Bremerella alba TaxID=980252 RepID=A0A7V8V9U4_9BACT|nr:4-alpha-glucanotransferase [Bremerella alba]MBA2117384.1 4-alpha-glucanotransferase [Bremerella alba]
MSDDGSVGHIPPFPKGYRGSGILLHVTSLPGPYGIGDFGPEAIRWLDLLRENGQSWWQVLPLGPTGRGGSPYLPLSSFAINEILVSPDWLIEDGWISETDADTRMPEGKVDFESVTTFKYALLEKAWGSFNDSPTSEQLTSFQKFCQHHHHWLEDYALFRALKVKYDDADFLTWPQELVNRQADAIQLAHQELESLVRKFRFFQYLLAGQAGRVRDHARANHIRIVGDVPIYVSAESSEAWANPDLFMLDEEKRPKFVAGVPPDYFSALGQLWGNPVYNWEAHRRTGYRWFIDRLRSLLEYTDAIRLDHFRGFAAAWNVPAEATTAVDGAWVPGPGAELFEAVQAELGSLPYIVEDLGTITKDVYQLRDQFELPGTLVLQFAFDGDPNNTYLPENYAHNAAVYTGTHDNATTRQWYEKLTESAREIVWRMLGMEPVASEKVAWQLIRTAWSSDAALAIAPLQDVLNLGGEARMNVPGEADGNWNWRCPNELLDSDYFVQLKEITKQTDRIEQP